MYVNLENVYLSNIHNINNSKDLDSTITILSTDLASNYLQKKVEIFSSFNCGWNAIWLHLQYIHIYFIYFFSVLCYV